MNLIDQRGAAAVIVAICIALLLGFGALAVDVGHLYLSRGELQNAADACALGGARVLYLDEGTAINTGANQEGHDAGEANESQRTAAEIDWTAGNDGDVQRGHWNFNAHGELAARSFTPNGTTTVPNLFGVTTEELDADTSFVNSVRCVTRREATPVTNFLAPVLGVFGGDFATSIVRAEAVAIVGFAGTLEPHEVDAPIAVCENSILEAEDGSYDCTVGRMLNDSGDPSSAESAMWTTFQSDPDSCSGLEPANNSTIDDFLVTDLIQVSPACRKLVGNPNSIGLGGYVPTNNGVLDNLIDTPSQPDLIEAWKSACADLDGIAPLDPLDGADSDDLPEHGWALTLPVIDCASSTCNRVVGAVTVNVVWIRDQQDPHYRLVPLQMDDWVCINPETGAAMTRARVDTQWNTPINGQDPGQLCWYGDATDPAHVGFVEHFNLLNADGNPAPYANETSKAVFFKPSCEHQPPTGHTGGENFGILAKYPALVR